MKRFFFLVLAFAISFIVFPQNQSNAEESKSNDQSKVLNQKEQRQENFSDSGIRSFGFPVANWTDTSITSGKNDRPSVIKDQNEADREFLSYITSQIKQAKTAVVGSNATNPISCHGNCVVYSGKVALIPVWAGTGWTNDKVTNWNLILSNLVKSLGNNSLGTVQHILSTNKDYFKALNTAPSFTWLDNTSITPIPGNITSISDGMVPIVINNYISAQNLTIPTGYSPIYIYIGAANTRLSSGFGTRYCGWHTYGTLSNFKNIPYIAIQDFTSTYLSACAAQTISPNKDAQLDAMASVLVHEIDESITDPLLNSWYDARGAENADKCAWTFGVTSKLPTGAITNVTYNGINYLIQQNWLATNKVTATGTTNSSACTVTL